LRQRAFPHFPHSLAHLNRFPSRCSFFAGWSDATHVHRSWQRSCLGNAWRLGKAVRLPKKGCSTSKLGESRVAKVKTLGSASERRASSDRRNAHDRRTSKESVAVERRVSERRKVPRRRQIDPTTCERDYTTDEIEFMHAMDAYKRANGRMFPTCSEILEVVRNLGYAKTGVGGIVAEAVPPSATEAE
jgi:hypothetical protein